MRRMERVFGVLAGILGMVALLATLTQGALIKHVGLVILSPATATADSLAIEIPVGLASLGSLLISLGAVCDDTRRWRVHDLWTALVVVSAALCALGIYMMSVNNVWVTIGGPAYVSEVSAAALFAPAAVMGIVAAVVAVLAALLLRGHVPAHASLRAGSNETKSW